MMTLNILLVLLLLVILICIVLSICYYRVWNRRRAVYDSRRRIAHVEQTRVAHFVSLKALIIRYKGTNNPLVEGMNVISDEEMVECLTSPSDVSAPDGHLSFSRLKDLIRSDANLEHDQEMQSILDSVDQDEEILTAMRQDYNDKVHLYNDTISSFPCSLIARLKRYRSFPYIELKSKEEEIPDLIKLLS